MTKTPSFNDPCSSQCEKINLKDIFKFINRGKVYHQLGLCTYLLITKSCMCAHSRYSHLFVLIIVVRSLPKLSSYPCTSVDNNRCNISIVIAFVEPRCLEKDITIKPKLREPKTRCSRWSLMNGGLNLKETVYVYFNLENLRTLECYGHCNREILEIGSLMYSCI